MVKCRIGEEKATALLLMRKYIAYQFTNEPLQIKSVVAPEGVKGYIYIEAYKQPHVKAAINNVGNLRMGVWNQQVRTLLVDVYFKYGLAIGSFVDCKIIKYLFDLTFLMLGRSVTSLLAGKTDFKLAYFLNTIFYFKLYTSLCTVLVRSKPFRVNTETQFRACAVCEKCQTVYREVHRAFACSI